MSILICRVYIPGTSARNYTEAHNYRVWLDEKTKNRLKLLKETILKVNDFLLFNFVFFSYRKKIISKHLALVWGYLLITDNLNYTITLTDMNLFIRKFEMIKYINNFRIGTLFWHISITFSDLNDYRNPCWNNLYFINITRSYNCNFINPNLGGLFRGSFWGGEITPLSKTR